MWENYTWTLLVGAALKLRIPASRKFFIVIHSHPSQSLNLVIRLGLFSENGKKCTVMYNERLLNLQFTLNLQVQREVLTYKNPVARLSQVWISHSIAVEHLTGHEFKPSWGLRGWRNLTKTKMTNLSFFDLCITHVRSVLLRAFYHPFPPSLPEVP